MGINWVTLGKALGVRLARDGGLVRAVKIAMHQFCIL